MDTSAERTETSAAGKKFTKITSEGVDIMLLLDTSGSMQAMDFEIARKRVNRLEVVKRVVIDFIEKRPNDRIGMVALVIPDESGRVTKSSPEAFIDQPI